MTLTVNKTKAGFYESTYNFESEDDGEQNPTDWTNDDGVACDTEIIAGKLGHLKVLQQYDQGIPSHAGIYHEPGTQDEGIIQFWIASSAVGNALTIDLYGTAPAIGLIARLKIEDWKFQIYTGGAHQDVGVSAASSIWYNGCIVFNHSGGAKDVGDGTVLADNSYRVWINGTKYGDWALQTNLDLESIYLWTEDNASVYYGWWDAFGFSWDGYTFDDNFDLETSIEITSSIRRCKIIYPFEGYPTAEIQIESDIEIIIGETIQVKDNYTSAGATNDNTQIFLGQVIRKLGNYPPSYLLKDPSQEMDRIREYTSATYTKDTDGLIAQIISDGDVKFISNGALTDGADLGTISLEGDKTFRRILDSCARIDGYTWYLHPDHSLYYNTGAVDTGVDIDGSDATAKVVQSDDLDEHITRVEIKGGMQADGSQAKGNANDIGAQGTYGIIIFRDTDAMLNTDALCAAKATLVLAKVQYPPKRVVIEYLDTSKGFLQPGENITLSWDEEVLDKIEEAQYIIEENVYNAITGFSVLTVASGLIFSEKKDLLIIQEHSQMIQQHTTTLTEGVTVAGGWFIKTSGDTDDYIEISTVAGVPTIKSIGTDYIWIGSDAATSAGFRIGDSGNEYLQITYSIADDESTIYSRTGNLNIRAVGLIDIKPSNDVDDYIRIYTDGNICRIGAVGNENLYFYDGSTGNWNTVHADAFTEHTAPMPTRACTTDILNVKATIDGKLDKKTLPSEAYYVDKNGGNEGMKLGAMVLHLTKTIQELEARIKDLEVRDK